MKNIELLAPAGSYDGMVAAVNAGCDAVYIGGSKFGARAYADNLSGDDLLRAIDYMHLREKKLYLTINTLIKSQEFEEELFQMLEPCYIQGLDAVIVQDIGVLRFIHRNFPNLSIHASTQLTLTMAEGAKVLEEEGISRFVLSREIGLEEIKTIRSRTNLEIEAFVHGALCYCYSGQCLMSSMIGGRSGNRGRCAQPCRMPYQAVQNNSRLELLNGEYLLSPKDICTLTMIPELIKSGIDSFKIEGRMKGPEYAAGVTAAYRKQIELYKELGDEGYQSYQDINQTELIEEVKNLQDLYNRGGFSDGYYKQQNGKSMMSMARPNHTGVFVGYVTKVKDITAFILLEEDLHAQDILEMRTKENPYEFTRKESAEKGQEIAANFMPGCKIEVGTKVYRTKNNYFIHHIYSEILKEKKLGIKGKLTIKAGEPILFRLEKKVKQSGDKNVFTEGLVVINLTGPIAEPAAKQPVTAEKISSQMKKTNDSPFIFDQLEIEMNQDIFLPISQLNEFRREGLRRLEEEIVEMYRRKRYFDPVIESSEEQKTASMQMVALIRTGEQLRAACREPAVTQIYGAMEDIPIWKIEEFSIFAYENGKQFYVALPRIFREKTYNYFCMYKDLLLADTINGFIITSYEQFYFFAREFREDFKNKELRLDANLYIMNDESKLFWQDRGVRHFTAPLELNSLELMKLGIWNMDFIVYSKLALMVSAQCLRKNLLGCKKENSAIDEKPLILVDRKKKEFAVKEHCDYCYNTIYNADRFSLRGFEKEIKQLYPAAIRCDFTDEDEVSTAKVLAAIAHGYYIEDYPSNQQKKITEDSITKGHFKRGIL